MITSIQPLLPAIAEAGRLAQHYYRHDDRLQARLKGNRTVVTEADMAVETLLCQAITTVFPQSNIVGEEGTSVYLPQRPYTFAIDPIDGTAAFASGAPAWAICVGMLDQALQPVAGVVYAPEWDSLFVADVDPHSPATHNGTPLPVAPEPDPIDANTTILIDSKLLRTHHLKNFPGKCRGFGSTALHVCLVAQQNGHALAHSCPVYVWDIAAAHAIAARAGILVQYLDGQPLAYDLLVTGHQTPSHLVAGHPAMVDAIVPTLVAF